MNTIVKNILIFFTMVFILQTAIAKQENTKHNWGNVITVSPIGLFNIFNPSIQIGYQRYFLSNYIFQIEAGIILKHSVFGLLDMHLYNGSVNYSYSGYRLQSELKRVLLTIKSRTLLYVGGEISYLKNKGNVNNVYFDSNGESYKDFLFKKGIGMELMQK